MRASGRLAGVLGIAPGELRPTLLSAALFCALLCSYYLLRPLRDEIAVQTGVARLPWTFTATFLVMLAAIPLFGWLCSRFALRRVLPAVYLFFAASLLVFDALLARPSLAPAAGMGFFVWVSVFNLFVVSVFWSLMADMHDAQGADRLFGLIAAGGSVGAIGGPLLAVLLAGLAGTRHLLPASALCLGCALLVLTALRRSLRGARTAHGSARLGGRALAGLSAILANRYLLGIAAWLLLHSTLATFLYFGQTEIVGAALSSSAQRTQLFAAMDLTVNVLTLLGQIFLAGRLMRRWGSGVALAALPAASLLAFALLLLAPALAVVVGVQIARRSINFFLARPARETLFTVVSDEDKYKAKNVIDTVVYRGGDAASGWLYSALGGLGLGLAGLSALALPLAAAWLVLSLGLGRRRRALEARARREA